VPHDLYVEILDAEGEVCATGERGEITVTCARNPFLPLLRYRTGDYAALEVEDGQPVLIGFEGRQPVTFVTTAGKLVNNIDVTQALEALPLGQFSLHQHADGALLFKARGGDFEAAAIERALHRLFGFQQPLRVEELER
jgi:phenylacetate-CoA ligase